MNVQDHRSLCALLVVRADHPLVLKSKKLIHHYFYVKNSSEQVSRSPLQRDPCPVCSSTSMTHLVTTSTTHVCLGNDGLGCGAEVDLYRLQEDVQSISSLFSDQYLMQSHMSPPTHELCKWNLWVEKKLTSYVSTNLTTSDFYKDKQRVRVYAWLIALKQHTTIPSEKIDQVQWLYHKYRKIMSRIHKLNYVVYAMFLIVYNVSSF